MKKKGPLSAPRRLCGEGPHSFTASNRCLRHPRRFRFISDRLTVCLKNGDNLTWHFSAIGVGTVCRKNGTFGPLRNAVTLLGSRLAHTCRILACMRSQRNTRSLYDLQRPHTFHSAERMRHPWRRRGLKTKGPLSASRCLCGEGPHSFTASNRCLRHPRRFRFISDRLTVCLRNGDNLTWHFSAIGVGTVCRKNGTFWPLRNSVTLLGSGVAQRIENKRPSLCVSAPLR